ncbi:MAG: hypothetical protein QGH06_08925, partial [Lutibacter sp.]|nr:hypothetical protein [Lutibacter sp.]
MRTQLYTLWMIFCVVWSHTAQQGIAYQATLLNPNMEVPGHNLTTAPLSESAVCIQFSFYQADGSLEYQETQHTVTDLYGRIDLVIGQGNPVIGTFDTIVWDGSEKELGVAVDYTDSCSGYNKERLSSFHYVPYAFFAENTAASSLPDGLNPNEVLTWNGTAWVAQANDGVADADNDPTNEIQDLQLNGHILTITNNGTATDIDLSAYLDNTDTQLSEAQVDAFVNNNGYLTTEVDGSVTNEIQDLQLNG